MELDIFSILKFCFLSSNIYFPFKNFIRKHLKRVCFTMTYGPRHLYCGSVSNCGQMQCGVILHSNNDT